MKTVKVFAAAGDFAENKDTARALRIEVLMPALEQRERVIVDFSGVSLSTQSFIHALISDAIRQYGTDVLDRISFKGCNSAIRALVSTVCDYMQDGAEVASPGVDGRKVVARQRGHAAAKKK
jgi:hypothetical protein